MNWGKRLLLLSHITLLVMCLGIVLCFATAYPYARPLADDFGVAHRSLSESFAQFMVGSMCQEYGGGGHYGSYALSYPIYGRLFDLAKLDRFWSIYIPFWALFLISGTLYSYWAIFGPSSKARLFSLLFSGCLIVVACNVDPHPGEALFWSNAQMPTLSSVGFALIAVAIFVPILRLPYRQARLRLLLAAPFLLVLLCVYEMPAWLLGACSLAGALWASWTKSRTVAVWWGGFAICFIASALMAAAPANWIRWTQAGAHSSLQEASSLTSLLVQMAKDEKVFLTDYLLTPATLLICAYLMVAPVFGGPRQPVCGHSKILMLFVLLTGFLIFGLFATIALIVLALGHMQYRSLSMIYYLFLFLLVGIWRHCGPHLVRDFHLSPPAADWLAAVIVFLLCIYVAFSGNHLVVIDDLRNGRFQTYAREYDQRAKILENASRQGKDTVQVEPLSDRPRFIPGYFDIQATNSNDYVEAYYGLTIEVQQPNPADAAQ